MNEATSCPTILLGVGDNLRSMLSFWYAYLTSTLEIIGIDG